MEAGVEPVDALNATDITKHHNVCRMVTRREQLPIFIFYFLFLFYFIFSYWELSSDPVLAGQVLMLLRYIPNPQFVKERHVVLFQAPSATSPGRLVDGNRSDFSDSGWSKARLAIRCCLSTGGSSQGGQMWCFSAVSLQHYNSTGDVTRGRK